MIVSFHEVLTRTNSNRACLRRRLIDPYPCRSCTDAPGGLYFARVKIPQTVMRIYMKKYEQRAISKEIIDLKLGDVSCKMLLLFFISKIYIESLMFFVI